MLSALRLTVIALLGSKKFVMAVLTVLAGLAAKYGLGFSPEAAFAFLSPLVAAIVGQGIADHGKEAAMITASAAADAQERSIEATIAAKQGGFVGRYVMLGLAAVGVACVAMSCAWMKSEGKTVATAAVDCTKGELGKAVKTFSPLLDQLIVLATGGDGHVDTAQLESGTKTLVGDIGGCVLSTSVAKALKPAPAGSGSPQSSPLVIDPGELRAFYETKRAALGGKSYLTEAGPL